MKLNKSRTLAMTLTLSTAIGLLSACDGKQTRKEDEPPTEASVEAEGADAAGEAPVAAKKMAPSGELWVKSKDTDGDARVSRAEFDAHRAQCFEDSDADDDGFVTVTEMEARQGQGVHAIRRTRFVGADADRDGKLSRAEFDARSELLFTRFDADQSADISLDEAKAQVDGFLAFARVNDVASPDLAGFYQPRAGLYTGGQPTRAQLERAAEKGVKLVINLRTPGEEGALEDEQAIVEELGMAYVSMPIVGPGQETPTTIDAAHAKMLGAALQSAEGPALVHCSSGNRVAALIALHAHATEGYGLDDVLAVARAAGLTKPPVETVLRQLLEGGEGEQ